MSKKKKTLKDLSEINPIIPFMLGEATASSTSMRRNLAGDIERTDRFKNIDDGLVPFRNSGLNSSVGKSSVDCRDAVVLCQKAYYNFPIFRNTIDLMTEFSVNNIFFRGGNKKSRDFFKALFDKINLLDFQDKFFREYYRSANVFTYRFDKKIQSTDIEKITQVYADDSLVPEQLVIPSRYIILNPADVQMIGTANFAFGDYYKLLNPYEIARLKIPQTEEDKEVFNSLPPEAQKQIQDGSRNVLLKLDNTRTSVIMYKVQDYEPFGVPMGYGVLEDINAKAEMKKIDMAIARTMQQIILLVTTGDEPDKGGVNPKNLEALRNLFLNQSIGRYLIADYSTKVDWKVPAIGDLLDPKKYEVLERDINIGLNNIFMGGEKFANQAQKVELFIARLEQGRRAFLNNFLIPEIKRISKSLNFKNFPTPYFEDIELKDNTNFAKLYVRLIELGILTPEQGLKAIESNTLPDPAQMVEEQKDYKSLRDKGLYEPLIGAPKDDAGSPGGPPSSVKKVTPIGKASEEDFDKYSLTKVKENLVLAQEVELKIIDELKIKNNIKRVSKIQRDIAEQVTHIILANEEPARWKESIKAYLESPEDRNKDRVNKVYDVAANHSIDLFLASILLASRIDAK